MLDNNLNNVTPDVVLNKADPGDDTLRRFRYQLTYAGIVSALMLDENAAYEEVFCEHHEDVLIKYLDKTYRGIQVKTRDINLPPFNIEDTEIIKSFKRFIELDIKFPGLFQGYSIVSNNGFDKSKPSVDCNSLIEILKKDPTIVTNSRTKFSKFVNQLSTECNCSVDLVINCLRKVNLKSFSSFDDIFSNLINCIKASSYTAGCTESHINQIAETLLLKHFNASSLKLDDLDIMHYVSGNLDTEDFKFSTINSKKISKSEIITWINLQKDEPVKLLLRDKQAISNIPSGYTNLQLKMDAGKIDSQNIDLIRNFKFSLENHAISWLYKNGAEKADQRYSQVSGVIQNICQEIYDEMNQGSNPYGLAMLREIRKAIKERKKDEANIFFDCSYEHLLGMVGVLTESCKVWWSEKFDITL